MPGRIDWEAVRERLRRADSATGRAEREAARRQAVFERRARDLAVPAAEAEPPGELEVLVFGLDAERYALPTRQVREVRPLGDLAPLPGTPPFVAGLVNLRGRIVPVLDLRPVFGRPTGPAATVLVVPTARGDVGLLATDRPTVRRLPVDRLTAPPAPPAGIDPASLRGVGPELIVLLDGERLLASPRLLVDDEAAARPGGDAAPPAPQRS